MFLVTKNWYTKLGEDPVEKTYTYFPGEVHVCIRCSEAIKSSFLKNLDLYDE